MELLNKFLSNQITLPEFLEKSEGKIYQSSKEGIEFMTNGLEKAIQFFNYTNADNIKAEPETFGSVIRYNITYYKRKYVKATCTQKEDIIETILFTSYINFKTQAANACIIKDNITYNYIGSDKEGIKYYLREVYYDDTTSNQDFIEQYYSRLYANTIKPLDCIYSHDPLTNNFKFKAYYSNLDLDISYDMPLSTKEYFRLREILKSYPIIANSIVISTNGTFNNDEVLDYLKDETAANSLIKTIKQMHENLNKIFKK